MTEAGVQPRSSENFPAEERLTQCWQAFVARGLCEPFPLERALASVLEHGIEIGAEKCCEHIILKNMMYPRVMADGVGFELFRSGAICIPTGALAIGQ